MTNKERAARLDIKKIDDAYEIINHHPRIGPYDTKLEARYVLKSTRDFYLYHCHEDDPPPAGENPVTLEDIIT